MFRIAICEDNLADSERLTGIITAYLQEHPEIHGSAASYESAELLSDALQAGRSYEVYFIDIMMPGRSGVDLASDIRAQDAQASIIFTTSAREYALNAYGLKAIGYLLKPIKPLDVHDAINTAWRLHPNRSRTTVMLENEEGLRTVYRDQIMYVENSVRTIRYVLHNEDSIICKRRSGTFEEAVGAIITEAPEFMQPHKSYIINNNYIALLSSRSILMDDGKTIPIAQKRKAYVRDEYFAFLGERSGDE